MISQLNENRKLVLKNLHIVLFTRSRSSARSCMEHAWLRKNYSQRSATLPVRPIATTRLADFVERRQHQVCCSSVKSVNYWLYDFAAVDV